MDTRLEEKWGHRVVIDICPTIQVATQQNQATFRLKRDTPGS